MRKETADSKSPLVNRFLQTIVDYKDKPSVQDEHTVIKSTRMITRAGFLALFSHSVRLGYELFIMLSCVSHVDVM